jgi:peptidoglycan L-alanyl-D-glutamate endopeptidase CwlK
MAFPPRSEQRLVGVHEDLVRVARRALELSPVTFVITEGLRTAERQAQLLKAGASKTMRSRHLTGHAIDVAPIIGGEVRWDWPPFRRIAAAMKQAAAELGVPIVWGGDWRTFKDGPHFELDRKVYP